MGGHTHDDGNYAANNSGSHDHTYSRPNTSTDQYDGNPIGNGGAIGSSFGNRTTTGTGNHSHNISGTSGASNATSGGASNGQSGTNRNLPPYYALCYIMKT